MAFKFSQRQVGDPASQQNFEQLEGELDQLNQTVAFAAHINTPYSVGAASPAYAPMTVVEYDTHDAYAVSPVYGRWGFIVPEDGIYHLAMQLTLNTTFALVGIELRRNGGVIGYWYDRSDNWISGARSYQLAAGDFIETVITWSGGAASVSGDAAGSQSYFCGHLIGRL